MPERMQLSGRDAVLALTEAVAAAYNAQDWHGLRALYHDDARLSTIAAHQEVVGPDEVIRIFESTTHDSVYSVGETKTTAIDEHAVLVSGRIRYRLPERGFADAHRSWILTFKDGLLFRSHAYTSDTLALSAYRSHGISLGI